MAGKSKLSSEIGAVANASDATITNGNTPQNGPPYQAEWLTIKAAAVRANVSGQAVRKATEKFTTIFDGKTFMAAPRDMFGNAVGREIEYVDAAAIDAWLLAKAENPSRRGGRKPAGGERNYTVRLTEGQLAALTSFLDSNEAYASIEIKRNERKAKPTVEHINGVDASFVDTQDNDLFDVDVA